MKHFLRFSIALMITFSCIHSASAQTPSNVTINGILMDSLGNKIEYANVMLLMPEDSTLINYTISNKEGFFEFKKIKNRDYLIKISHIAFIPKEIKFNTSENELVPLNEVFLNPINDILMEVVIKEASAPLKFKGDTIEYDARTFKVPPGSTVEDLLRKLPGINIDGDGEISTQGERVSRVYVDGKTFFNDDPKSATKNLDANTVSKVQVYDEGSEEERLTGIKDGNTEKVMNLELKDEYKKGQFGKITLAAGTKERKLAKANYNRFNAKNQLSFIAYSNNLNQAGMSWDDYSSFKGNNAWSRDNGDFGFGSGRHNFIIIGGNAFYTDDRGYSSNYGGGANYNYTGEKSQLNFNYLFGLTDFNYDQYTNTQYFLQDTGYYNIDTTKSINRSLSHAISGRYSIDFDSLNSLIIRASGNLQERNQNEEFLELYQNLLNENVNEVYKKASQNNTSKQLSSLLIYNRKFKKPKRSFSLSGTVSYVDDFDNDSTYNSNLFLLTAQPEQIIDYFSDHFYDEMLIKSSALYVEPIKNRISTKTFYNFSSSNKTSQLTSMDPLDNNQQIDSLSLFYNYDELYNRIGTSINYNYNGLNISLGGAIRGLIMKSKYAINEGSDLLAPPINKTYLNLVPNFSANYQFPNKLRINGSYSFKVKEPSVSQLQPVPNLTNILYITEGNPNLDPERYHEIRGRINYYNRASFASFYQWINYKKYDNIIIYERATVFEENKGYVTHSRPINIDEGSSFYTGCWGNIPIIKTKLSTSTNLSYSRTSNPIFINEIKNITISNNYGMGIGLELNIGEDLNINSKVNQSWNNTSYSIQSNQDQSIESFSVSAGFEWKLFKKTYFDGNYSFNNVNSDKLDYSQDIHRLNISIRQILGKKDNFELRIAAVDLLDQEKYLRQYATENSIYYSMSPTLSRYFLFSFTYNLKNFNANSKPQKTN